MTAGLVVILLVALGTGAMPILSLVGMGLRAFGPADGADANAPPLRVRADRLLAAGNTDGAYDEYLATVAQDPGDRDAFLRLTLIALLRQARDRATPSPPRRSGSVPRARRTRR